MLDENGDEIGSRCDGGEDGGGTRGSCSAGKTCVDVLITGGDGKGQPYTYAVAKGPDTDYMATRCGTTPGIDSRCGQPYNYCCACVDSSELDPADCAVGEGQRCDGSEHCKQFVCQHGLRCKNEANTKDCSSYVAGHCICKKTCKDIFDCGQGGVACKNRICQTKYCVRDSDCTDKNFPYCSEKSGGGVCQKAKP